ncbi:MAG: transporter substrate-binding domain-containing protein [Burkholderiales bacterium]|nr:transporter substrate-binding domain-containing protein [Burkholderiales bacterium]
MPPFTFNARVDGHKTEQVVGASVDLLKQIGRANGWEISVQLLPWARCLAMVQENHAQIALDASRVDAENNRLTMSKPYFSLHSVYFTSRRAQPQGVKLNALSDLKHYRLCGLGGHRFELFGIDTRTVDLGTMNYEALIAKLHLGRCDLFIENREVIGGMYLINPKLRTLLVDGTLVSKPLPGSPNRDIAMAVSPLATDTPALLAALNAGIARAESNHDFDQFLGRYLE